MKESAAPNEEKLKSSQIQQICFSCGVVVLIPAILFNLGMLVPLTVSHAANLFWQAILDYIRFLFDLAVFIATLGHMDFSISMSAWISLIVWINCVLYKISSLPESNLGQLKNWLFKAFPFFAFACLNASYACISQMVEPSPPMPESHRQFIIFILTGGLSFLSFTLSFLFLFGHKSRVTDRKERYVNRKAIKGMLRGAACMPPRRAASCPDPIFDRSNDDIEVDWEARLRRQVCQRRALDTGKF